MSYPIKPVKEIDFNILTKNILKRITKFPTSGIIKDDTDNNGNKKDTVLDPRMGVSNYESACDTCKLNDVYCPGHFGHINLARPVYHIGYIMQIKMILECICIRCAALKVDKTSDNVQNILKHKTGINRLSAIRDISKDLKNCRICNTPLPKIKIINKKEEHLLEFNAEFIENKKVLLTNDYMYSLFSLINDEDCIVLGLNPQFSRPVDLFYTYFPVPPVPSRPSVKATAKIVSDDIITQLLINMIKHNNYINSSKESQGVELKIRLLQYYANIIYSNNNKYASKLENSNKPTNGIIEKIKNKKGLIRSNLMGKRNNYTARTVITGDPMLDDEQVGIPIYIAKTLTYQEIVNKNNFDKMKQYYENGPDKWPGANYVIPRNNYNGTYSNPIDIKFNKRNYQLKIGDKLERHMMDGDIVFFNRQPSLHKYSMMAMKAKIIDNPNYTTFRFNVGITEPFHADFDGDEMTITIPRSEESKIEIEQLTSLKHLLVNTQTSTTTIGCKLDTLTSSYILSKFEDKIPANRVMNILSYLTQTPNISDFIVDKNKLYTGKELLSFILPKKLNVNDKLCTIQDGQLIKGLLGKEQLKEKSENSILRIILDLYDENEAITFLDNLQKLLNMYLLQKGITFGVKDIETPSDVHEKAAVIIKDAFLDVGKMTTEIENDPSIITSEVYEEQVRNKLSNTRDTCGQLIMHLFNDKSNIEIMRNAGTSGKIKPVNIAKNVIVDAQNESFGERPHKTDGRRTQCYFCRDIDMPYERGYDSNSFYHGLNPFEFIWNAYTAREGIIDIQIHTPDSGYVQRKFVKILEDYHIDYDGLVKNVNNGIVQFVYSDSNIDASKQYICFINILKMDDDEIKDKYIFNNDELKEFNDYTKKDNDDFYEYLIKTRDFVRNQRLKLIYNYQSFDELCKFYLPVSLNKIKSLMKYGKKSDLSPKYIINKINELLEHKNTYLLCIRQCDVNNKSIKMNDEILIKTVLRLYLFDTLAPKRCIYDYKINKDNFDNIITDIIKTINNSLINPGEMVGVMAGTSLCENITQTNLNSHHLTGVSSKTAANAGFPRIEEIINYTKINEKSIKDDNIPGQKKKGVKTPQTYIYFNDKTKNDKGYIDQITTYVRQTKLNEIYDSIEVYYDPENKHKLENPNIFKINDNRYTFYTNNFNSLPWLLTIKLQKDMMLLKHIQLLDIIVKIIEMWTIITNKEKSSKIIKKAQNNLKKMISNIIQMSIAQNDDNDEENIIQIRFNMVNYSYEIIELFADFILDYTLIKGLSNIKESNTEQMKYISFDNDKHKVDESKSEYYITTAGINIEAIRNLRNVDLLRTRINDIETIYNTYGIETVRTLLIDELNELTNNNVMFNHISLVVDYMTREGYILSIDRHGLDKSESSLLNRISFEKPGTKILSACLFNQVDNLNGVSGRIMTGRTMRGGTGYCDLMFNTDLVMNSEYTDYNNMDNNTEVINDEYNALIEAEMDNEDDDIFIP